MPHVGTVLLVGALILSWLLMPASAEADAVLTFWNHPIVTFRATVRSTPPPARVAAAQQRLEALERDVQPEEVSHAPIEIDGVRGELVAARSQVLFGIMPGDLDPSAGETLEVVSQRATEQLRAALAVREEQLRPSALLAAGAIALAAAIGLALVLLAIRRAAVFARAHDPLVRGPAGTIGGGAEVQVARAAGGARRPFRRSGGRRLMPDRPVRRADSSMEMRSGSHLARGVLPGVL